MIGCNGGLCRFRRDVGLRLPFGSRFDAGGGRTSSGLALGARRGLWYEIIVGGDRRPRRFYLFKLGRFGVIGLHGLASRPVAQLAGLYESVESSKESIAAVNSLESVF